MRRGPLADSYWAAVVLVVLALVPFLTLTAGVLPLAKVMAPDLGMSPASFDLTIAMSNAAYAFGTVLAVQFAQHLPPRRMLMGYVTVFVVAAALAAWAPTAPVFVAGFVMEGLCTSLMLIAAVPALVTGWPTSKMPGTAMIMNLCIFGAVALGPTIGAVQAAAHHWRPLFWAVGGVGLVAWLFVVLTYEDDEPADREAPWDVVAVVLAAGGCAAAFFGAGYLQGHAVRSVTALAPLCIGFAAIVVLVVQQYLTARPLMPVRRLATTYPVTGITIALFTSAAAFGLMQILLTTLAHKYSPNQIALYFLPEFAAAVLTAGLFARVFRTRLIPALAFSGIVVLAGGAVLASRVVTSGGVPVICVTAALIGLGVGASVSPALFMAGFSLRSSQIQRVFALIELLRGVAAFITAPVLAYVVTQIGGSPQNGARDGVWICLGLVGLGVLLALGLFIAGSGHLQAPDLDRWQDEDEPAWETPSLFARLRDPA
jgi:MFS family permease